MDGILLRGRNCYATPGVNESGLLVDGREYYLAFWKQVKAARRYVWIAGWQFDSETRLIRGDDTRGVEGPVGFLAFLDEMCRQNPSLHVNILAWDFSLAYALERERMQRWLFDWSSSDRLRFQFDDQHPVGASHHQKFAVVDGNVAFVGGMDICASRWDDRAHRAHHRERYEPHGRRYGPYHDVQAWVTGEAARELAFLFRERWRTATGEELPMPPVRDPAPRRFSPTLSLPASRVGFSRTRGRLLQPPRRAVDEIRCLYEDAILAAERFFYLENQYFTSQAVFRALADRMRDRGRPRLDVVFVLPRRPAALKEDLVLGMRQAKMLRSLERLAQREGHQLGIFYPTSREREGSEIPTYVHAKVMQVDDRLVCVGSANTTNRSLGLDTELNVSWEAGSSEEALRYAIGDTFVDLMSEHSGTQLDLRRLRQTRGIVGGLEEFARSNRGRLRTHPMDSVYDHSEFLNRLVPKEFYFDPERAEFEENVWEALSTASHGLFATGVPLLRRWLEREE